MNLRVDFPPWHQCHLQYLRLTKTDRELTQKLQKAKQKHCLAFVFGQTRCIICSKWNWKILNILTTILAVVLSSRKQNAYSQICCRQPCWNIVSPISTSPSRLKSSSFWGSRTQSVMLWKSPHESAISFFFFFTQSSPLKFFPKTNRGLVARTGSDVPPPHTDVWTFNCTTMTPFWPLFRPTTH